MLLAHIDPNVLIGTIASVMLIAGGLWGAIKGLHRLVVNSVAEQLHPVQQQVTNNGGSSMKDAVDRIEREVTRQGRELDTIAASFERHLGFHEGQQHAIHS